MKMSDKQPYNYGMKQEIEKIMIQTQAKYLSMLLFVILLKPLNS
jgi:hypothetical protein